MPYFLTLFLLSFSLPLFAQEEIQLSLSNPYPRVGETVEVKFSENFTDAPASVYGEPMMLSSITFKEAREYTLGPFEFMFDGQSYKTNSIQVKVEPALPLEEGIWLRWYEEEGKIRVLVEELIPMNYKVEVEQEGLSSSYETPRKAAKIKQRPEAGITFSYRSGMSKGVSKNNSHRGPHYQYHLQQYIIRMDASRKKGFKLLPKHFEHFKKGLPYTPITIPYLKKS